jgi:hypothetical protein
MTPSLPSGTRRGLLARLSAAAAAAGAAAVLPRAALADPVAEAASAPLRELPSGYRETERVRTCYRLARY